MFRILACLQNQHDVRLIAVAFTICVAASGAAVYLLRQSMRGVKDVRWPWVAVSGVAAGFGVWATHFVAMLAYMPGLRFGFDLPLTLASLVAVMLITTGAFAYVAHCRLNPRSASAGGALFGLGVGVMHYMGMKAVLMPARISWSMDLASASLLLGAGFGAASLHLLIHGKHRSLCTAAAAGLIALSVLSLHFTAMGAITLKLDPARVLGPLSLSPVNLATVIAVVAIAILAVCVAVAAIDNRADQATRETERRFQILVQGVTDYAIFMLDPQGYVSNWNSGAEHLKGYSAAEIVGKHMSQFYLGKERAAGAPQGNLSQALREGKFEGEGWRVRKDGSRFWAHVLIDPIWSDDGQLIGFAKVTRDITQQKQDNDRIMDVTRNLNAALSHMSQGLTLYDANDRLVLYNKRLLELYDLTDEEVRPGSQYIDILRTLAAKSPSAAAQGPEFVQSIYANSMAAIRQPGGGVMMGRVRADRDLIISFRPLPDGGWVSTVDDITELRSHQAQIAHMATHDTLTGLPNRAHINERIDATLEPARRMSRQVAVIAIDLDRFKDINDIHGHRVGDAVLKVLADRMLAACRFGECVARVGGDEFAALKVFDDRAELDAFLALLRDGLSEPFSVDGVEMEPSGSLGVALYPADGASREILANNAGLALKRAKASLDNRVRFYEARMDDAARLRRDLAHELWTALERQEFQVFYQVQNDVQTGAISGFEALVRWPHPQRGWVSPAEFIPLAEECGAILDLGAWVLRTACAEVASWAQPYKVAVNLSPLQLTQLDLAKFVHETLIETGLSARYLELEITESVIIGDKARALHVLRQIKAMGVTIAMDDFGTGYSSLDTLQSFPFDKIKIDRSFLVESETNPQSKAIIRAIIALGRSLGVPVLAEGVETHAQLAYLRAEGCDQVQGYLFGRPQPGHQLFAEAG